MKHRLKRVYGLGHLHFIARNHNPEKARVKSKNRTWATSRTPPGLKPLFVFLGLIPRTEVRGFHRNSGARTQDKAERPHANKAG